MNKDYYIIENKGLAIAISYLISEDFYTFNDKFCKDRKLYSFIKTDKFKKALDILPKLRKEFN